MDIGVASLRNLSRIHWHRVALFWLLALSSIPIHFLYNSAVFKTLEANNYLAAVVNEDFLNGEPFYGYQRIRGTNDEGRYFDFLAPFDAGLAGLQTNVSTNAAYKNASQYERLSNSDCMKAYGTSFVSGRYNVLAITSTRTNMTNQTAFWSEVVFVPSVYTQDLPYGKQPLLCHLMPPAESSFTDWVCMDTCNMAHNRQNATNWEIGDNKIDYCLSELMPEHCRLQFSIYILVTVIIMNACKSLAMLLALYQGNEVRLVTIGDALASFLNHPDDLTQGRCMMAKVDVGEGPLRWSARRLPQRPLTQPLPVTYHRPVRRRWFAAASTTRWLLTLGLISVALGIAVVFLVIGTRYLKRKLDSESVFSLGFGTVDSRAIIVDSLPQSGSAGLVADVLTANLPQVICSFLYFAYNGLFTCMLLSSEYSQYGQSSRSKPLRVSNPKGRQSTRGGQDSLTYRIANMRAGSKYFLQLPYTYSIPLIVGSAVLHWLISQSIFLVRVTVSQDSSYKASQLGFSCAPMLTVIVLGSLMLLTAPGFGFRKNTSCVPVAGSCSAVLSAACHPPKHDVDAAYLPVRWGAVSNASNEEVGHCCFTSGEVHDLVPGRLYAGLREGDTWVRGN